MKLAKVFKFVSLKCLLIELIWKLALLPIISAFILLIGIMTYFLEGPFVVILILSLTELNLLIILFISVIFLWDTVGNVFLIWMISSILIFKACVYDFLLSMGWVNLLLIDLDGLEFNLEFKEAIFWSLMKHKDIHWQNVLLF